MKDRVKNLDQVCETLAQTIRPKLPKHVQIRWYIQPGSHGFFLQWRFMEPADQKRYPYGKTLLARTTYLKHADAERASYVTGVFALVLMVLCAFYLVDRFYRFPDIVAKHKPLLFQARKERSKLGAWDSSSEKAQWDRKINLHERAIQGTQRGLQDLGLGVSLLVSCFLLFKLCLNGCFYHCSTRQLERRLIRQQGKESLTQLLSELNELRYGMPSSLEFEQRAEAARPPGVRRRAGQQEQVYHHGSVPT